MKVIAHRGASAERPENTLAAYARAHELGADMIELDLRASADGVLFAAHDPVPAGGAGRRRVPARLTWAEVRERAGTAGLYPALAEVLDQFAGKIELNLEVKEPGVMPILAHELARRGLSEGLLVSSFDLRATRSFSALAPRVAVGLLTLRPPVRIEPALLKLGARTLHVHRRAARPGLFRRAHALGVPVYVWTVDAPDQIRLLADLGADGVFTNDPREALQALGRLAPAGAAPAEPASRASL